MRIDAVPMDLADDELLCVVGPTATQKTELAIRICEQVGGEVVGADSVQIYEHFDIGSGKPTREEQSRAVHHLVGTADPHEPVDAAQYTRQAQRVIEDIRGRARVPVVCGGTFLWVRALVHGLARAPAASAEVRARLADDAAREGVGALHDRLRRVDPETAARLSPNDFVRVQRALEVFELSGRPLSELHREHRAEKPVHKARFVGVRWDADLLVDRMRIRAQQWLASGWVEEVRRLLDGGFRNTRPMGSVGYRQVVELIDGRLSEEVLLERIVRATKIFARRQRTWLRDEPVIWRDPL